MPNPLLQVENLRTHFHTDDGIVKAVDGISFTLQAGEVLGIVGESGSGKSVLSLSMMRLLSTAGTHTQGRVTFAGADILGMRRAELQKLRGNRIAMIFQDPMTALNPFLTVERQLSEVLQWHRGLRRSAARIEVLRMLQRVGLADAEERADAYPHHFSGGMRQRVMIAMALLCEPALLIADEPTTALDVTIAAQILNLIGTLQRDLGMGVILITHDLGVVAGMADRIAVMYAGRIVEMGPTPRIFEDPRHPYTRGLLACIPRLDGPRRARLTPIEGLPPDLSALPPGCPFRPRCPAAIDRCAQEYPPSTAFPGDHTASCWQSTHTPRSAEFQMPALDDL